MLAQLVRNGYYIRPCVCVLYTHVLAKSMLHSAAGSQRILPTMADPPRLLPRSEIDNRTRRDHRSGQDGEAAPTGPGKQLKGKKRTGTRAHCL